MEAAVLMLGVAGERLDALVGVVVGEVVLAEGPKVLATVIVVILHDLWAFLGNVSRLLPLLLADALLRRKTE